MSTRQQLRVGIWQPRAWVETPSQRLHRLATALADQSGECVDLLVCPELFLSGYFSGDELWHAADTAADVFHREVAALARRHECAVIYGYPERDRGHLYNAACCIHGDGTVLANHRKTLLPHDYEERYFTRGHEPTTFVFEGWQIGLLICYEAEMVEPARYHARTGCDLLAVPTALTAEWGVVARRVIPARAFENTMFVAYANHAGEERGIRYLGESVIVSPCGEELARADAAECLISASLDRASIDRARQRLHFLADAHRATSWHPPVAASSDRTP